MADQIEVTSLAAQAASSIDSNTQVVAFTQAGDTTRLPLVEAVAYANQVNECICIKEASLTIASADVLTLNSTPIEIVAATGAGTAIEVLSASFSMTYNSVQYATNTELQIIPNTGSGNQYKWANAELGANANVFSAGEKSVGLKNNIIENTAINVYVKTGNPTAGDSDIKVYVTYRIITL